MHLPSSLTTGQRIDKNINSTKVPHFKRERERGRGRLRLRLSVFQSSLCPKGRGRGRLRLRLSVFQSYLCPKGRGRGRGRGSFLLYGGSNHHRFSYLLEVVDVIVIVVLVVAKKWTKFGIFLE